MERVKCFPRGISPPGAFHPYPSAMSAERRVEVVSQRHLILTFLLAVASRQEGVKRPRKHFTLSFLLAEECNSQQKGEGKMPSGRHFILYVTSGFPI